MTALYRKKPLPVEARQLLGSEDGHTGRDLATWCGGSVAGTFSEPKVWVPTLEGGLTARVGDWIVKGPRDEFWPVKGSIFADTYEDADTPLHAGCRADALAEVTAWLVKKAREFHVSSRKREREQGDTCAVLASKIAWGAVRPDNLRMLPDAGFFEVDRTYEREHHGATVTFKVEAISTSPDGPLTVAHGWRLGPDFGWEPTDSDDFAGWTDVTEAGDGS
jgi:hypothetical protein